MYENHSFSICHVFVHDVEENEVRTMVDPNSKNDRKLQELVKVQIVVLSINIKTHYTQKDDIPMSLYISLQPL